MVPIDLQRRTALVTGASRGIGRAIAVRLAEAGARLVVHYRSDHQGAEATVDAVTRFSEGHAASADLTDAPEIEDMFAPSAPYGAVDILVNNAGIYPSAAIEEMTSAEWAEVFRVNVDATFACLQAAARSMSQRSQGAIVNTCSLSALRPAVRQSHYNSSKAAVLALTRSV